MTSEAGVAAPELPRAKMHLVRPTDPVVGRVVSTRLCLKGKSASFVRHVAIDVSGTPLEANFLVGQSFGVLPPGTDEKGKPQKVRLYSIACPSWGEDGAGRVLSTTPKRVLDEHQENHRLFLGVCSNHLCDLQEGDAVRVTGPNGRSFLLPARTAEHDYLFVATGTGIAPFRGMVMELLEAPGGPCPSQIHLVMGAPYTTDLLYDELFRRHEQEHENFHYHTAISREARGGSERGIYVDALIEEMMDETFRPLLENPRTLIYVCGLAGMQIGLYKVLARCGLGDAYLSIKDEETAAMDPEAWDRPRIRRFVRATKRCMLEVY